MGLISRLVGLLLRREATLAGSVDSGQSSRDESSLPAAAIASLNEGVENFNCKRYAAAIACLEKVIQSRHDWADAHYYLGLAHLRLDRLEEASDCLSMALCFAPRMAAAHFALALVERKQGRLEHALASIKDAVEGGYSSPEAHNLHGALCLELGDVLGAVESFRNALDADPDCASAHSNLGYVLFRDCGEHEQGAKHIQRALELDPQNLDYLCNYTMVLSHRGDYAEAIAIADRILAQRPDLHEARLSRALALLLLGAYDRAWDDYEARKLVRCNYIGRSFPCQEWQGEDLCGKVILAHGEQGLGDEIMFSSCFPDLIARAGRCIIECDSRLERLFERSFPEANVVAGEQSASLPRWWSQEATIDLHIAAGSLPRHFRRSSAAFVNHNGYLRADPQRVTYWGDRLQELGPGLKIGISWRGGMQSTRRQLRSIDLLAFGPILQMKGAHFVDLQYGDTSEERQLATRELEMELHHWQEAIIDLDETAALISGLDLVISVCTAVIHLSGAIGHPVWVLVPSRPEWRYLAAGQSMLWYPSARLFRQRPAGDWGEVIDAVAEELCTLKRGQAPL